MLLIAIVINLLAASSWIFLARRPWYGVPHIMLALALSWMALS